LNAGGTNQNTTFDPSGTGQVIVTSGHNLRVGGYGSGGDVGIIYTPNDLDTYAWTSLVGSTDSWTVGGGNAVGSNPLFQVEVNGGTGSGSVKVLKTTPSTSTTTGALVVSGGMGIAQALNARNVATSYGFGALPPGLTNGQNSFYVAGTGDTGGTSDLRPNSITVQANGSANLSARALDIGAVANLSSGNVSLLGVRMITTNMSSGGANGVAYSASPTITSSGNITSWTGYEADNGTFSSTGDVTGAMTGFHTGGVFGRAAATTVTGFQAQDLTKGTGNAYGFRGQVAAGTGKYNLYMDGTAANVLAGQTSITSTIASTDKDTGALVVSGGVGVAGNLNVGGTFSATNYSASGGTITGSASGGLVLNASTSGNQNIVVSPSGTGATILNGKVGVGTTTPNQALTIKGGMSIQNGDLANNGVPAGDLALAYGQAVRFANDVNNNTMAMISLGTYSGKANTLKVGTTSWPAQIVFQTGDLYAPAYPGAQRMIIDNQGNVGIGNNSPAAKLSLGDGGQVLNFITNQKLTGAWPAVAEANTMTIQSSGNFSGSLAFATGNTEAMRIVPGGNVGIGTSNPLRRFHIYDNSGTNEAVMIESTSPTGYTQALFKGTGRQWQIGVGNAGETGLGVANKFYLYDAGATAIRLAVDSSGNVGIGTTAPAAKLDVAGTIKVSGVARFDSAVRIAPQGDLAMGEFTVEP